MSNHAPKVDPISKIVFIISLLAIVAVVYVLLSSLVNTYQRNSIKGEIDKSQRVMDVADNLQPIGTSATSDAVAVAPTAARSGKEVYNAVCSVCHKAGVADAPKLDDKAAWEPRVATGLDALMTTAINGKGAMPARGGNPSVTDEELKATILYMTKAAGFDLGAAEPANAEAPKAAVAPKEETPKTTEDAPKAEEPKAEESAPATADVIPAEITAPEATTPPVEAAAPVVTAEAPATSLEEGKKVYDTACFACHATGVAGSPKLGDKAAWAPRIATGLEALYTTSLNGKGAMPPKGGNMALEDDKVKAAVDYMVNAAK